MPQIKKSLDEARIPFAKMSFSPDVPSTALGANEYNSGANVETDVRGIRSVSGEEEIFQDPVPGTAVYISSGFRSDDRFWTIVANTLGEWYATTGGVWRNITPVTFSTGPGYYTQNQNITEAWSGTVPIFNDEKNPPFFWPEDHTRTVKVTTGASGTGTTATLTFASVPTTAVTGASGTGTTATLTFAAQILPPYAVGSTIIVTGMSPSGYNGTYVVTACTTTSVSYANATTGFTTGGLVSEQPFTVGQTILVENIVPTGYRGTYTVTACTRTSVSYADTDTGAQTVAGTVADPFPVMTAYSNTLPNTIANITTVSATEQQITLDTAYATAPYVAGEKITITDVNRFFDGTYTVVSSTPTTINYTASPGAAYPGGSVGAVRPQYTWNYNPLWSSYYAKFMRMYNTPNVGSILVAGNLVATTTAGEQEIYPVTVQWSQSFGLNDVPATWQPTLLNVANQLEVPLRGEAVDAFPCNGNFFLCSYWDTVVFSPINYSTTSTPILGVRLFNQGRGLLSSNTWATTDDRVFGVDARDIWMFDGQTFTGIGNQRIKNWFYDQLDPNYADRVYVEVNTQRNQFEIYYPTTAATNGVPNKMIAYRYDLDCWNPPKDVDRATFTAETPVRFFNSATQSWRFNKASRTIMYARGGADQKIVQMNQGYSFVATAGNPTGAINSSFRRDNIKMIPDYSGKVLVHRILPEVNNLKYTGIPINPAVDTGLIGDVTVTVQGALSVGQSPQSPQSSGTTTTTLSTDTDNPWIQINQNASRVNSLELSHSSTTDIWICPAVTVQYTQTEDDR